MALELLRDARDVVLMAACVTVMRCVWKVERARHRGERDPVVPMPPRRTPRPREERFSEAA